jgi:hypothetical protein
MIGVNLRRLLVGLACMSVLAPASLQAEGWNFKLSPYIWATSLKGTASIGPVSGDIDLDFGDILSNLEMALMLNFRAEKDLWAIQADGVWADLESDITSGAVRTTVGSTMWIGSLNGRYRFADDWEALAGVRYFRQDVDINVTAGGPGVSASAKADWIDPVVGVAFNKSLSDKWSVQVQGDIGGFGVGSDFAWQAWLNFDWRFSRVGSLALGWRHLDWDYEEGSGLTKFTYDAYLSGPVVGVTFRF